MDDRPTRTLLNLAAGETSGFSTDEQFDALSTLASAPDLVLSQLLPLVLHQVRYSDAWRRLDPGSLKALEELNRALVIHDVVQRQWLENFLKVHLGDRTRLILLKGAAFHGNLYPSDAPRPSADIDVLVEEHNFAAVCDLVEKQGGRLKRAGARPVTSRTLFEAVYRIPGPVSVTFEVHRGLTKPWLFRIDYDGLWERSVGLPGHSSQQVRMLSPEDTLLHLAVHSFLHAAIPVHAVVDAHLVLTSWKVDEDVLVRRANQWGASTLLFTLLRRVDRVFENPAAQRLVPKLAPGWPRRLAANHLLPARAFRADAPRTRVRQALSLTLLDSNIRPLAFAAYYAGLRTADLAAGLFSQSDRPGN